MRTHALTHDAVAINRPHRGISGTARLILDRYLLLPIGTLVALVWANTFGESYFSFAHATSFAVNEIGMALVLALIVQETYEGLMSGGALHGRRTLAVSAVAAAGGIAGAALVYGLYVRAKFELVLAPAWPVAVAVDVVAAYYIARMIWRSTTVLTLVLVLTLFTDAFGVLFVAVQQRAVVNAPLGAALMLSAIGAAALLRRRHVVSLMPYLAGPGLLSWASLYLLQLHPALALAPVIPFLPRAPRGPELFADPAADDEKDTGSRVAVHRLEHRWNELAQAVLFLFGLVNGGVLLQGYGTGTWALMAAGLVGRPAGLLLGLAIALAFGLRLPRRVAWRDLVVIAFAVSGGFTFPLFFATGIFARGPILGEIKLGVLTSVIAGALAFLLARGLGVGRFAAKPR